MNVNNFISNYFFGPFFAHNILITHAVLQIMLLQIGFDCSGMWPAQWRGKNTFSVWINLCASPRVSGETKSPSHCHYGHPLRSAYASKNRSFSNRASVWSTQVISLRCRKSMGLEEISQNCWETGSIHTQVGDHWLGFGNMRNMRRIKPHKERESKRKRTIWWHYHQNVTTDTLQLYATRHAPWLRIHHAVTL